MREYAFDLNAPTCLPAGAPTPRPSLAKPEARFAQGFTLTRRTGLVNRFEPEIPVDS